MAEAFYGVDSWLKDECKARIPKLLFCLYSLILVGIIVFSIVQHIV